MALRFVSLGMTLAKAIRSDRRWPHGRIPNPRLGRCFVLCDRRCAVADLVEPAELLDVYVDQLTRSFALIAANRLGGLSRAPSPLRPRRRFTS